MRAPFPVHIKLMKTSSTGIFLIFQVHIDSLLMFYHPEPSNISIVMIFLDFTGSRLQISKIFAGNKHKGAFLLPFIKCLSGEMCNTGL